MNTPKWHQISIPSEVGLCVISIWNQVCGTVWMWSITVLIALVKAGDSGLQNVLGDPDKGGLYLLLH